MATDESSPMPSSAAEFEEWFSRFYPRGCQVIRNVEKSAVPKVVSPASRRWLMSKVLVENSDGGIVLNLTEQDKDSGHADGILVKSIQPWKSGHFLAPGKSGEPSYIFLPMDVRTLRRRVKRG